MIRCKTISLGGASLAALALPSAAHAHSFESGADAYASFLAGVGATYEDLGIVLLLLAAGLLLALDKNQAKLTGFAALLVGALAGCVLSLVVNITPAWTLLISATLVAALAAWRPSVPLAGLWLVQAWSGGVAAWAVFAGHETSAAPIPVYVGAIFAVYFGVAASGGIAKIALDQIQQGWVQIAARALSSWVAAIAIMTLAFVARGGA